MSRKRWKEVPKEHRDAIVGLLERSAEFCEQNGAPKSAHSYRTAAGTLDALAKPTLRERLGKTKRSGE